MLSQNLRQLLPAHAADNAAGEIRISVDILQLTVLQGQALLEAQVDIDRPGAPTRRIFPKHQRPLTSDTPADVVALYSQLIADLATDIATLLP